MSSKTIQSCSKFSCNRPMTRAIGAICSVLCVQKITFSVWRLFGVTGPSDLKWSKWSRMLIGWLINFLFNKIENNPRILLEGEQKLRTLDFDEFRKLEKWRGDFDLRVASGMSVQVELDSQEARRTTSSLAAPRRTGLSEIKTTKTRTEQKTKKRQKQLTIFHDTQKVNEYF